jgi:hypothetical protein
MCSYCSGELDDDKKGLSCDENLIFESVYKNILVDTFLFFKMG